MISCVIWLGGSVPIFRVKFKFQMIKNKYSFRIAMSRGVIYTKNNEKLENLWDQE